MYRYLEEGLNHTEDDFHHEDEELETIDKPWGQAIGAAIIVQMTTLTGLVVVAASVLYRKYYVKSADSKRFTEIMWTIQHLVVPSFAVGALLATAVFLIIPEALLLLKGHEAHVEDDSHEAEEDHEDHRKLGWMIIRRLAEGNETASEEDVHAADVGPSESEVAWKFGAAFLGGFIFPFIFGMIFPHGDGSHNELLNEEEVLKLTNVQETKILSETEVHTDDVHIEENERAIGDDEEKIQGASTGTKGMTTITGGSGDTKPVCTSEDIPSVVQTKNIQLASCIIIGDFCHNLADGFFIGTAFLLCSKTLAWTIIATTIYHEIAQEIADFSLLTTHCGLTIFQALFLNFCTGLSVVIGVIIVFSFELEDTAIGAILSISAGVFVYIAAAECVPRIQNVLRNTAAFPKRTYYSSLFFLFFILGAVPIGLVLLNHEHCEAEAH